MMLCQNSLIGGNKLRDHTVWRIPPPVTRALSEQGSGVKISTSAHHMSTQNRGVLVMPSRLFHRDVISTKYDLMIKPSL